MCHCPIQRRALLSLTAVVLLHASGAHPVSRADVFELPGGGRLQGEWLNGHDPAADCYQMQTAHGAHVVLDKSCVVSAREEVSVDQEYQEVVNHHGKDVAGQWAVAEWCREHGLTRLRAQHLRQILELDPNHIDARVALGYSQVGGRWVTREESMRERGYVLYRGKWCLSQQVELMEAQRRRELAERQWYRQLVRWRRDLTTERGNAAQTSILSIRDPLAVPAVATLLSRETMRAPKLLWIRTLANIRSASALGVLVQVVLNEGDLEIVHSCLDCLVEIHSPLVQQQFLETLRHESNQYVNRAGLALGRLGETSAIDALIDALVTEHVVRINEPPDLPIFQTVQISNTEVLSALIQLGKTSGYGYDEQAWKHWHFLQNRQAFANEAAAAEVRRGE